mgnify:CR=1 FL=1
MEYAACYKRRQHGQWQVSIKVYHTNYKPHHSEL